MTTTRTLATIKYIIDITVEYEQMSAPTAIEEDLKAVVSAAFKGCGFLTAVQEDESIGATVKERLVVAAPIKETTKEAFNLKSHRKLDSCTTCNDNKTPWMTKNGKDCTTTELVPLQCYSSNNWKSKKFCQLSCIKANHGYKGDDC